MTVLQKIINEIKLGHEPANKELMADWLEYNYLKLEEQQIRDAFRSGVSREYADHFGKVPNPYPSEDQYINQLKHKP